MALSTILGRVQALSRNNSSTVLTGVGVAGTVSTAILAGRASYKAAYKIARIEGNCVEYLEEKGIETSRNVLDKRDMLREVWPLYIPAVGVGVLTVTSIILANRVASKEAAALMAAYTVSERALHDYREKVIEKIGTSKEQEIRDSVAEARIVENPPVTREVIIAGSGDVLCYDVMTGRYFQSSKNEIEKAENYINLQIVDTMAASLSEFYDAIGLPPTGFSDVVGFNANRRCRVRFSTHMSPDGRPCLAIDFIEEPVADFAKLWG